ncbi:hypothetical protein KQH41_01515 [bacterium]|nr:hypothetical protein [bacterium]
MNRIYFPDSGEPADVALVGGKANRLAMLANHGYRVPPLLCLTTAAYDSFVGQAGLKERISLELNRKDLTDMRWEELWDAALRIKALFRATPFPSSLRTTVIDAVDRRFHGAPLVVRSSAPTEDTRDASFAGLHETVVGVRGDQQPIDAVVTVWASLFSDRALLYRQELGLDSESSSMAVIIQELVASDCSGVAFTRAPYDDASMVIEAVYGQNQGLVDGDIEPDRWMIERETGRIRQHQAPQSRTVQMVYGSNGLIQEKLAPHKSATAPLAFRQIGEVAALALDVEGHEGVPQDLEWTIADDQLYLLQARPITTQRTEGLSDNRAWYLSLHRSFDNLLILWQSIENEWLPAMDRDAEEMALQELDDLDDGHLAEEIERREQINSKWISVYWAEFIPFAHGIRLFGDIYNDLLRPDDPYEFVRLLSGETMLSTRRNDLLMECAVIVRDNPAHLDALRDGKLDNIEDPAFVRRRRLLSEEFCLSGSHPGQASQNDMLLAALLSQYILLDSPRQQDVAAKKRLEERFVERAAPLLPFSAEKLLALGRASYRLRDDDNIHIGRIARQFERAVEIGRRRLVGRGYADAALQAVAEVTAGLRGEMPAGHASAATARTADRGEVVRLRARQLTGQPASAGIATGRARVITSPEELHAFRKGEILVTDSIDPTMTFFAPLAAAIVERRGGMLIHGAIIAREYGIPCITGISDATQLIKTGDQLVVDGFLGIVTLNHEA